MDAPPSTELRVNLTIAVVPLAQQADPQGLASIDKYLVVEFVVA